MRCIPVQAHTSIVQLINASLGFPARIYPHVWVYVGAFRQTHTHNLYASGKITGCFTTLMCKVFILNLERLIGTEGESLQRSGAQAATNSGAAASHSLWPDF